MYGMVRYEALPTIELSLLELYLSFPFYECQSNEMSVKWNVSQMKWKSNEMKVKWNESQMEWKSNEIKVKWNETIGAVQINDRMILNRGTVVVTRV